MSVFAGGQVSDELSAKFVRLGGVQWLRKAIAEAPEPAPDARPVRGVPLAERIVIASTTGPAKPIARKHGIPVAAVYRFRQAHAPLPPVSNAQG